MLEKIELNDFGIKTEGAKYLVEVLKVNTSLKYILLRCNDLGDEGMKHLKEGLKVNGRVSWTIMRLGRRDQTFGGGVDREYCTNYNDIGSC